MARQGRLWWALGGTGIAAVLAILAGCDSQPRSADQLKQVPGLKPLGLMYSFYVGQHQGKSPPSEADLKTFIKSLPAERLKQFNIDDVDAIFTSPRDGKPYQVTYGGKGGRPGGPTPVAWEQDGKGGKRFVVDSLGKLEEVDEAKFQEMVHKTPNK
jgi:hypothetical protein